jgi:LAO/AO transport system kinase
MSEASALLASARGGERRALARLVTMAESPRDAADLERALAGVDVPASSQVIGVTGAPGAGKSTCTAALIAAYRARGVRVAVLAVDPSSPLTGGALLGDRIRMQQHALDEGVFIRSMAARGHLGGLAVGTALAARALAASGFEIVLIETVGVGQSEVEIVRVADTTVLLLAPGMGDGIQAVKAGIGELADIFVVNKADHPGAELTVRDLKATLALGGRHSVAGAWRPRIVTTIAVKEHDNGVDQLVAALDEHREWRERHRGAAVAA